MVAIWKKRADELERLSQFRPLKNDDSPDVHGVLLSDEIARLSRLHKLITPFNPDLLKPAAYHLTVGDEFFLAGQFVTLQDEDEIKIPPFEVVVIKTAETLCMPRFLIARWNLQVRQAYRGLLWVGGPQVDPGYIGHLFAPIYNLSDTGVTLRRGEQFAVIDFVKTTPVRKDSLRYPPTTRPILEDFGIDHFQSALFTKAGLKIIEVEQGLKAFETRFATFTQITIATLALAVATMAALLKVDTDLRVAASIWGSATLAMSFGALLLALFWYFDNRFNRFIERRLAEFSIQRGNAALRFLQKNWIIGFLTTIGAVFVIACMVYTWTEPFLSDIRRQRVLVQSDLTPIEQRMRDSISAIQALVGKEGRERLQTIQELNRRLDEIQRRLDELQRSAK